ncbi:MAG: hypothetical protein HY869_03790 [Chloroflexi bacterium]|nr:hypothetical protein [Chloroflexota bacterium]
MNKKIAVIIFTALLVLFGFVFSRNGYQTKAGEQSEIKEPNAEPVTFGSRGTLRELTIDDLIQEAELIIMGRVEERLPSLWINQSQGKPQDATAEEIFMAEGLFTDSIFAVTETIKGGGLPPTIRVRMFTGETEQVRWSNSSEPEYKVGSIYLLFLVADDGPTQVVNPGDYIAVNAIGGVYEILDDKAVSKTDEWNLNDLLEYIRSKLQQN